MTVPNGPGQPPKPVEEIKGYQQLIPFENRHRDVLKAAAKIRNRSVTDYIRHLTLRDMQALNLLDATFAPIERTEELTG